MDNETFYPHGQRGNPQLVRSYVLDDPAGFSVTVYIGDEEAFCTCRTFANIDYAGRYSFPQHYYGSTGAHGCNHIDYLVAKYGWAVQCDHDQELHEAYQKDEKSLQAVVDAFEAGLRQGLDLSGGIRG